MRPYLLLTVAFCLPFFFGCHSSHIQRTEIDLIQHLIYSERIPDTQVIAFGTPEGKSFLLSGWSTPEHDHGMPFQWAIARDAAFQFESSENRPVYLHLVLKSFFLNPAEIYLNDQLLSRINIDNELSRSFLPLPTRMLNGKQNVVKLQFQEVRTPEAARDPRQLAAAAYLALITPSKYIGEQSLKKDLIMPGYTSLRNKSYPAVTFRTGGSLRYFEKLNRNAILKFGYRFHPAALAENDDFAKFRILIQKDGDKEKEIFSRHVTEESTGFFKLPLSGFIQDSAPSVYRITFRIDRNSILNDAETSWLQPTLEVQEEQQKIGSDRQRLEALRDANRGANVLVMLLDAGGAKHFHSYGYGRNTTPVADRLASQGVRFSSAYSNAVFTLASTASLMTGMYPEHHRILYINNKLPSVTLTVPQVFDAYGYQTGTFVANGNASSTFGMTHGFREIAEVYREQNYSGWGQEITDHFTKWLEQNYRAKFFAYLHYREPHEPYNPPEQWVKKFVDASYAGNIGKSFDSRIKINTNDPKLSSDDRRQILNLYDANLAYGDWQVGQVLSKLKQLGIYDNTIVIVTADHGEAFWEHGYQGHSTQVYQESIHIPLIIKFKNQINAGAAVAQRVRTIDVFPTLLDLLEFSSRRSAGDGKSFLPYLAGTQDDGREVISTTTRERQYSYMEGNYKYIADLIYNVEELYDLSKDPAEQHNLISSRPVLAKYYRCRLLAHIAINRALSSEHKAEHAVLDESSRENLKALGYIDSD